MVENIVYNRYSYTLTNDKYLPASIAMLYATGLREKGLNQPRIVSNWYEGKPCHMHLNIFSKKTKENQGGLTDGSLSGGTHTAPYSKDIIMSDYRKHIIQL